MVPAGHKLCIELVQTEIPPDILHIYTGCCRLTTQTSHEVTVPKRPNLSCWRWLDLPEQASVLSVVHLHCNSFLK